MMETYSEIVYYINEEGFVIKYYKDMVPFTFVHLEPSDSDYQDYLDWVASGNTAEEWGSNGNQ